MYLIYQAPSQRWILRLKSKRVIKVFTFSRYIDALDAVQTLQLHLNKYDRRGQVLRKVG